MHYRVVIQGRALGNADVAEVKKEFVRVTGLSTRVADDLFNGSPQVIKRKVEQADAERIAATLRAVGVAATVEREPPEAAESSDEGIRIVANPLAGPPTIAPGMAAAAEAPSPPHRGGKLLALARERWLLLVGIPVAVFAAIELAPFVDEFVTNLRPAPAPVAVATKRAAPASTPAADEEETVSNRPALLHGPWRCTDQRTGTSVYWTYAADGGLAFHGEVLKDFAPKGTPPPVPRTWRLDGDTLAIASPDDGAQAFTVTHLTLRRLSYTGPRGLEVECRRP